MSNIKILDQGGTSALIKKIQDADDTKLNLTGGTITGQVVLTHTSQPKDGSNSALSIPNGDLNVQEIYCEHASIDELQTETFWPDNIIADGYVYCGLGKPYLESAKHYYALEVVGDTILKGRTTVDKFDTKSSFYANNDYAFLINRGNQHWLFDNSGFSYYNSSDTNPSALFNLDTSGKITATGLEVDTLTVNGESNLLDTVFAKAIAITEDLIVTGQTTLQDKLILNASSSIGSSETTTDLYGTSKFHGDIQTTEENKTVEVAGAVTLSNTLSVSKKTTLSSTLNVSDTATFDGAIICKENVSYGSTFPTTNLTKGRIFFKLVSG